MVGSPYKKNAPYRTGIEFRTYRYDYIVTYSNRKFNPKNSIKFGNFPKFIGSKNESGKNVPHRPHCPVVTATKNIVSLRGGRRSHPTWQSPAAAHRSPTTVCPGILKGIATPVCALARNDSSISGCTPSNYFDPSTNCG